MIKPFLPTIQKWMDLEAGKLPREDYRKLQEVALFFLGET